MCRRKTHNVIPAKHVPACSKRGAGISFAMILITLFLLKLPLAHAEECKAIHLSSLLEKLNAPATCDKDESGRYLIQVDFAQPVTLDTPIISQSNNVHLKGVGINTFVLSNDSNFNGNFYYGTPPPTNFAENCSIILQGTNNLVEGVYIKGRGICIADKTNAVIKSAIINMTAEGYGIFLTEATKTAAASDSITISGETFNPYFAKLLCTNAINGSVKQTNLDTNSNGIDDYQDYHSAGSKMCYNWFYYEIVKGFLNKLTNICESAGGSLVYAEGSSTFPTCNCPTAGYGLNKDGKCAACDKHQILKYGLCIDCGADEISKSGKCVKCAVNEIVESNKCVECAEDEVVVNGTCTKCAADEAIKNFKCVKTACNPASEIENTDKTCSCKKDFGRYLALPDMPCVDCGSGKQIISGGVETCECSKNYHHEIDGSCVPDSTTGCKVANAVQVKEESGDCYCKDGYGIKVYDGKVITCEETGLCSDPLKFEWDSVTKICLSFNCLQGEKVNPTTGLCEPGPEAPASGDCGCNFGASSMNMVQSALPYLVVALGGIGIAIWRRKKI